MNESTSMVLVCVRLVHPTIENTTVEMNFIFDRQPQAADIIKAYATDPFWCRHEHCDDYAPLLAQCLASYGVPQLHKFEIVDADSYLRHVTHLTCMWECNIVGRGKSASRATFGSIRVALKQVHTINQVDTQKTSGRAPTNSRPPKSK